VVSPVTCRHVNTSYGDMLAILLKGPGEVSVVEDGDRSVAVGRLSPCRQLGRTVVPASAGGTEVTSYTTGGTTYRGIAAYIRVLFSRIGLFFIIYFLIGVFSNTAPPHLPPFAFSLDALHSWIQYFISILFWPLSFWHPIFSVAKWPAGSTP
jgi:hypothetical protein